MLRPSDKSQVIVTWTHDSDTRLGFGATCTGDIFIVKRIYTFLGMHSRLLQHSLT